MSIILEIKQIIKSENLDIDLNLSDELLIQKFKDEVDWDIISKHKKVSEGLILSEKFIQYFQNEVDWESISAYKTLSEKFIEKFKDKVDWFWISRYQKLSEEFIFKYWNKLNHNQVIMRQKSLTQAFLYWLYISHQEEEYNLLKYKNNLLDFSKKIEEEVKIVLIEFESIKKEESPFQNWNGEY